MTAFDRLAAQENAHQLESFAKWPLAIERGAGCRVFDSEGRAYLDFYGGHCVALTGHCHPRVVAAVQRQAAQLLFYSNAVYSSVRAAAAEALMQVAPANLRRVFFSNSGAEANENALKMARAVTGKPTVISFIGSFHGRTAATLSATGLGTYAETVRPALPGFRRVPFGDFAALEAAYGDDVAGVLMEPIQSMAGMVMAEPDYYRQVRALVSAHGGVLIFDEVQTALGRTGHWFVGEHWGVQPDIITGAKGLASGVPIGATLVDERVVAKSSRGDYGSTFGAGPLAMAALQATVELVREEGLPHNATAREKQIRAGVEKLPRVRAVRGLGLLLGLVLDGEARPVIEELRRRGVLAGGAADPAVLRLMPPLTVTAAETDEFLAALAAAAG